MRVASYDAADLERQIGPRDSTTFINSTNRHLVQNWLCAQGVPSERAKAMRIATLYKCYTRPAYFAAVMSHLRDGVPLPTTSDEAADLRADTDQAERDNLAVIGTNGATAAAASSDKGERLASLIRELAGETVNEQRVIELIREHAPRPQAITVSVIDAEGLSRNVGLAHRQFPQLLKACAARDHKGNRLNIWLSGPAGSGKTTAAEQVADALGLDFFFNGAIDNEYKLLGFVDANGKLISRPFREAYESGGVYLFDEIDASLPGALLAFNAATANGQADFPDGMVRRHPDCVIIAAGNTFGLGGTSDYVGRMKQDAAFLDRFAFVDWRYDEHLETELSADREWTGYVQACRARAVGLGLRVVISPRASIYGASLLAAGLPRNEVVAMTLRKGMSDEQWESVQ